MTTRLWGVEGDKGLAHQPLGFAILVRSSLCGGQARWDLAHGVYYFVATLGKRPVPIRNTDANRVSEVVPRRAQRAEGARSAGEAKPSMTATRKSIRPGLVCWATARP